MLENVAAMVLTLALHFEEVTEATSISSSTSMYYPINNPGCIRNNSPVNSGTQSTLSRGLSGNSLGIRHPSIRLESGLYHSYFHQEWFKKYLHQYIAFSYTILSVYFPSISVRKEEDKRIQAYYKSVEVMPFPRAQIALLGGAFFNDLWNNLSLCFYCHV